LLGSILAVPADCPFSTRKTIARYWSSKDAISHLTGYERRTVHTSESNWSPAGGWSREDRRGREKRTLTAIKTKDESAMAMTGRDDLIMNPKVPFGRMGLGLLVLDGRQSLGKLRVWMTGRMSANRLGRDLNVKRVVVGHMTKGDKCWVYICTAGMDDIVNENKYIVSN
jgi:hypothetical protein